MDTLTQKFEDLMMCKYPPHPRWDTLSKFYDKYLQSKEEDILIPKKIHQIWLGGEIPDEVLQLGSKLVLLNPNWEYKLWTDEDVKNYHLIKRDLFNSMDNYGFKSDILRFEILNNEGGIYLDTDFEAVKAFDEILGGVEFFAGVGRVDIPHIYNSIMGSIPNHPLIDLLVNKLGDDKTLDGVCEDYSTSKTEIFTITGPHYLGHVAFNYMISNPESKVVVFPAEYFFPFPADYRFALWTEGKNKYRNLIHSFNTPNTTVIHLWESSWQIQRKLYKCKE